VGKAQFVPIVFSVFIVEGWISVLPFIFKIQKEGEMKIECIAHPMDNRIVKITLEGDLETIRELILKLKIDLKMLLEMLNVLNVE